MMGGWPTEAKGRIMKSEIETNPLGDENHQWEAGEEEEQLEAIERGSTHDIICGGNKGEVEEKEEDLRKDGTETVFFCWFCCGACSFLYCFQQHWSRPPTIVCWPPMDGDVVVVVVLLIEQQLRGGGREEGVSEGATANIRLKERVPGKFIGKQIERDPLNNSSPNE